MYGHNMDGSSSVELGIPCTDQIKHLQLLKHVLLMIFKKI